MSGDHRWSNYYSNYSSPIAPDVLNIKNDLRGWRELILPLASVLRWDQPYHPFIIIAVTTTIFSIVPHTQMSTLTTLSFTFLLLGILDVTVPFVGPFITGMNTWTYSNEEEFTKICERIASFCEDLRNARDFMRSLRQDNPSLFYLFLTPILLIMAAIGSVVNNLVLAYIFVTGLLLLPGIKH